MPSTITFLPLGAAAPSAWVMFDIKGHVFIDTLPPKSFNNDLNLYNKFDSKWFERVYWKVYDVTESSQRWEQEVHLASSLLG